MLRPNKYVRLEPKVPFVYCKTNNLVTLPPKVYVIKIGINDKTNPDNKRELMLGFGVFGRK